MAISNHERVGKAMVLLGEGLAPFVARECEAEFGENWTVGVQRSDTRGQGRPRKVNPSDPQFLLKVMWDEWNTIFKKKLGRAERNYVSELQDARNQWAHNESFSTDRALRAMDTAKLLLESVGAGPCGTQVDQLHKELLRQRFDEQARKSHRKATAAQTKAQEKNLTRTGLPSWREVLEPHDDVASGRFQLAEFAADLHKVWRGTAAPEYGDPVEFYRRTYVTEGLSNLIVGAARRFSSSGGDPVIQLQTNFGGGKTHALIALYHLASGVPGTQLKGVEDLLAAQGLELPTTPVQRAVVVGHQLLPGEVSVKDDGTAVHTMWGELAYQLGGADGYALVAESDRTGTNPGAALTELFQMCAPCLVLIDEWVGYARQLYGTSGLPSGSFDAHFSFAQALTDAATNTPSALLVATIPSSQIEVGGEGGQAALTRLENLFARTQANWRTATAEESFEIVRRRLFKDLSNEASSQRDAVVRAFSDLYQKQASEFPHECREGDYQRRMKATYPVHPELFDRLFGDWSALERFQRTRGVLRLMAEVVHALWINNDTNLLILPSTIPIDDSKVSEELLRHLDSAWRTVVEADVDGDNALPLRLDKENPNLGRYLASRKVARTVYFGSAPSQQAANQGLDDRAIKLGCVQPGDAKPAIFGDALRRLSEQATYLYRDGARYWYALQPTVNRIAQDRAENHFNDADVDEEIRRRLDAALDRDNGEFAAVHVCPRSSADVPDTDEARLVVLDPTSPHDTKTEQSEALRVTKAMLTERSGGARHCTNMLVFLAADTSRLNDLRQSVRSYLAWRSIREDAESLGLDPFQTRQTKSKAADSDKTVDTRIPETYVWVLHPSLPPDDLTGETRWEMARVTASGTLAERVSRRLVDDESLLPTYAGSRLKWDLDRVPMWRYDPERPGDDQSSVSVNQLWNYITQYLYLPRLVNRSVLEDAIRHGVQSTAWDVDGFGYAEGHDGERYIGLRAGEPLHAIVPSGLVVHPDAASAQLDSESRKRAEQAGSISGTAPLDGGTATITDLGDTSPAVRDPHDVQEGSTPTRYYGRITVGSDRWTRTAADVAEAIVDQLNRTNDVQIQVTIEVQATSSGGFDDEVQRSVTENAATLKFDDSDFQSGTESTD